MCTTSVSVPAHPCRNEGKDDGSIHLSPRTYPTAPYEGGQPHRDAEPPNPLVEQCWPQCPAQGITPALPNGRFTSSDLKIDDVLRFELISLSLPMRNEINDKILTT